MPTADTATGMARAHVDRALADADRGGITRDALGRALLGLALDIFREEGRAPSDVASELRFEAGELESGGFHPFARP